MAYLRNIIRNAAILKAILKMLASRVKSFGSGGLNTDYICSTLASITDECYTVTIHGACGDEVAFS
jgi:hypothetical protein